MNQPSAFSYISFIGRVGWVEGKKIITKTRNFKTTKEEESKSELATTSASNEVLLKRSAPQISPQVRRSSILPRLQPYLNLFGQEDGLGKGRDIHAVNHVVPPHLREFFSDALFSR